MQSKHPMQKGREISGCAEYHQRSGFILAVFAHIQKTSADNNSNADFRPSCHHQDNGLKKPNNGAQGRNRSGPHPAPTRGFSVGL